MTGPDPAATARRREVALAGHRGDLAGARAGLSDRAPGVRASALGALHRLGALEEGHLRDAAADPAPAVRARAAELAPAAGPAGVDLLVPLLSDPSPVVVEAACFGLGEAGGEAARPPVLAGLDRVAREHSDPLCREAAVAAVGAIGDQSGLATVLAGMEDRPAVRRRAVLALAAFEGPEVDAALERGLSDRDWQVRQAAEDLTGNRRS